MANIAVNKCILNYKQIDSQIDVTRDNAALFMSQKQMTVRRSKGRLGNNMMLFDMGVDVHSQMTAIEVYQAIEAADELFDIVLISERLDESLILMKECLCWDFEDIVFFTKNARRDEKKATLSPEHIEKLQILNSGDMLLYDHFLFKHEQAVLRFGEERMAKQIFILNSYRELIFKSCDVQVVESFHPDSIFKEFSDQVNGYVIDSSASEDCLLLSLPELIMVDVVRGKTEKLIKELNQATNHMLPLFQTNGR